MAGFHKARVFPFDLEVSVPGDPEHVAWLWINNPNSPLLSYPLRLLLSWHRKHHNKYFINISNFKVPCHSASASSNWSNRRATSGSFIDEFLCSGDIKGERGKKARDAREEGGEIRSKEMEGRAKELKAKTEKEAKKWKERKLKMLEWWEAKILIPDLEWTY